MWLTQNEIEDREARKHEQYEADRAYESRFREVEASYSLAVAHVRQQLAEFGDLPEGQYDVRKMDDCDCIPHKVPVDHGVAMLLAYDGDRRVARYFLRVDGGHR